MLPVFSVTPLSTSTAGVETAHVEREAGTDVGHRAIAQIQSAIAARAANSMRATGDLSVEPRACARDVERSFRDHADEQNGISAIDEHRIASGAHVELAPADVDICRRRV